MLVLTVFAATDKKNHGVPTGFVPLAVFLAMTGLAAVFGAQTSFAMNPARDLGPRMMSAIFYGREGKPKLFSSPPHGTDDDLPF